MAQISLQSFSYNPKAEIDIPVSKSLSNRVQIAHFLSKQNDLAPEWVSTSRDSIILQEILNNFDSLELVDVQDAGTVARFVTAVSAAVSGKRIITGTERMQQRPIGILVAILQKMGAKITYINKIGYLPLLVEGTRLQGGEYNIDSSVSSQFISALMLIAPLCKTPLILKLKGNKVSEPYLQMTLSVLSQYGVCGSFEDNVIELKGKYQVPSIPLFPESDWSALPYLLCSRILCPDIDLKIKGFLENSLQGDRAVLNYLNELGYQLIFSKEGVSIEGKLDKNLKLWKTDFKDCPDLAQPFAILAACLGISFTFTGLQTLSLKETDRLAALAEVLQLLGGFVQYNSHTLSFTIKNIPKSLSLNLSSYNDHRMAMSYWFLMLSGHSVWVSDYTCVEKSFPHFWGELEKLGATFNTK